MPSFFCRIRRLFGCKFLGKGFQYFQEVLNLDFLISIFFFFFLLVMRKN